MRTIYTILSSEEDSILSREFGTFIFDKSSVLTDITKNYKRLSPSEVKVTIFGEESDVLRFQSFSSFQFHESE